jgi:hypothetical protein
VIADVTRWLVTGDAAVVHVAFTGAELVDMSRGYTSDAVRRGRARTATKAFRITILWLCVGLGGVDFATFPDPVGIAFACFEEVSRSVIGTVLTVCKLGTRASEALIIALSLVGSTSSTIPASLALSTRAILLIAYLAVRSTLRPRQMGNAQQCENEWTNCHLLISLRSKCDFLTNSFLRRLRNFYTFPIDLEQPTFVLVVYLRR